MAWSTVGVVRSSRRQVLIGLPAIAGTVALAQAGLQRPSGAQGVGDPEGSGQQMGGELEISQPFVAGLDGYICYRNPALAISRQGTVLAFCGGRVDNSARTRATSMCPEPLQRWRAPISASLLC